MYHFDEIIDRRGTNALNTDGFRQYIFHAGPEKVFPYKDEEFVRMWVADMEFGVAPEILDAMRQRIDRRIFGYTGVYDDGYYQSFRHWCLEHYGWEVSQEELCFSPGIIPRMCPPIGPCFTFLLIDSVPPPKAASAQCPRRLHRFAAAPCACLFRQFFPRPAQ